MFDQHKCGTLIRAQQQPGYVTTNTIGDYIKKTEKKKDKAYTVRGLHV